MNNIKAVSLRPADFHKSAKRKRSSKARGTPTRTRKMTLGPHLGSAGASSLALPESLSVPLPPRGWPTLSPEALHGQAGEFVKLIGPYTESDPAALLVQLLVAVGNLVGRRAGFRVEGDVQYTNLFALIVGDTSKARKGTSWGQVRSLVERLDSMSPISSGLSSGEGLIWHVRDPVDEDDPGVDDKRLLVVETEFASVLSMTKRETNVLSPVLRNAWDTGDLNTLVKKDPAKATGAHISVIGHITEEEVLRRLDSISVANGFANRFLWVCVRRSKLLPEGGHAPNEKLLCLVRHLQGVHEFVDTFGPIQLQFTGPARNLWREVYPKLSEGRLGMVGMMTARAEAQTLRLACIYSLLDLETEISEQHLQAALALWQYCLESAEYLFQDYVGNPVADPILRGLRGSPAGLTRTEINSLFGGHKNKFQIESALNLLQSLRLATFETANTGGRSKETWIAITEADKAEKAD